MDILTTLHTMQAEIALAVILIVVLLTDLFLKTPSPKVMQRLSCVLLVLLLPAHGRYSARFPAGQSLAGT